MFHHVFFEYESAGQEISVSLFSGIIFSVSRFQFHFHFHFRTKEHTHFMRTAQLTELIKGYVRGT
jgi:hypothetical protein